MGGTRQPELPPVDLLRRIDSDKMKAWHVDQPINNVGNNDPMLSEPFRDRQAGEGVRSCPPSGHRIYVRIEPSPGDVDCSVLCANYRRIKVISLDLVR
jgi:hypothetical protein